MQITDEDEDGVNLVDIPEDKYYIHDYCYEEFERITGGSSIYITTSEKNEKNVYNFLKDPAKREKI